MSKKQQYTIPEKMHFIALVLYCVDLFERIKRNQFRTEYLLEKVNDENYYVNWKSAESFGAPDKVLMKVTAKVADSIQTRLSIESSLSGELAFSSVKELPYINKQIERVSSGKRSPLGTFDYQWINIFNSIDVR